WGQSALHEAVIGDHLKVVRLLIKEGVDLNMSNEEDITPLIYASLTGNKEILLELIANGAHVNAEDNKGRTSLSHAESIGHGEIVEILKRAGAR
ncbi:MAG: ankyrin repeat domain-containing protein, partial [Deltaproteobacteria bacterium]|nr:ankyrin repeat domain-containing protein [Deltaproteobacteria bacterium]